MNPRRQQRVELVQMSPQAAADLVASCHFANADI